MCLFKHTAKHTYIARGLKFKGLLKFKVCLKLDRRNRTQAPYEVRTSAPCTTSRTASTHVGRGFCYRLVHMYIYIYICMYMCIYIYIYIMYINKTVHCTDARHVVTSRIKQVSIKTRSVSRETSSQCFPLPSHNMSRMSRHARRRATGLCGKHAAMQVSRLATQACHGLTKQANIGILLSSSQYI